MSKSMDPLVDSLPTEGLTIRALGAAVVAHRIGETISFLSFVEKITLQQEKSQALHLARKLAAEAVGLCYTNGFPVDGILCGLKGLVDFSDDKLDYVAAFLNMSTNYVEDTGTQSVARSLIERTVGEI